MEYHNTIALFGDIGSGKSTIFNLAQKDLIQDMHDDCFSGTLTKSVGRTVKPKKQTCKRNIYFKLIDLPGCDDKRYGMYNNHRAKYKKIMKYCHIILYIIDPKKINNLEDNVNYLKELRKYRQNDVIYFIINKIDENSNTQIGNIITKIKKIYSNHNKKYNVIKLSAKDALSASLFASNKINNNLSLYLIQRLQITRISYKNGNINLNIPSDDIHKLKSNSGMNEFVDIISKFSTDIDKNILLRNIIIDYISGCQKDINEKCMPIRLYNYCVKKYHNYINSVKKLTIITGAIGMSALLGGIGGLVVSPTTQSILAVLGKLSAKSSIALSGVGCAIGVSSVLGYKNLDGSVDKYSQNELSNITKRCKFLREELMHYADNNCELFDGLYKSQLVINMSSIDAKKLLSINAKQDIQITFDGFLDKYDICTDKNYTIIVKNSKKVVKLLSNTGNKLDKDIQVNCDTNISNVLELEKMINTIE